MPFAGSAARAGYVFALREALPEGVDAAKVKEIISVDEEVALPSDAVEIAAWMRLRYFCRYIDALTCFAPSGTKSKRGKKRVPVLVASEQPQPVLTGEQEAALAEISPALAEGRFAPFLLHGVTGSGKTELYMRACALVLEAGKQAIVLVPEISLTPQIIGRFVERFGAERIAILHSKLSAGERYDEWVRIKTGEAQIVIGARSAVFAPAENIGLIVVDEEHETTYKSDKMPKYDTVEVALKRAQRSGAAVILGSATPSIVTSYRAQQGLYKKLELKERVGEATLPALTVADMRQELAGGNRSIFSAALYESVAKALEDGRQAILFLNRRGYSPFVVCRECGYTFRCPECGLTLTWHKRAGRFLCHFCGHSAPMPAACPACGGKHLRHFGIGTEKAEELTQVAFPDARTLRLDVDTSAAKGSTERILSDFGRGEADILIGTQMVAKGLDFTNVDVVGILAADIGLAIPDFRSAERTFALITQAAGRAGRGERKGTVIVQTYNPEHYAVMAALQGDYNEFYDKEVLLRETMVYPPFSDIIQVTALAEDEGKAKAGAEAVKAAFLEAAGSGAEARTLGPQRAAAAKVGTEFRWRFYVKSTRRELARDEAVLGELKRKFNTGRGGFRVIIDMNPFSLV